MEILARLEDAVRSDHATVADLGGVDAILSAQAQLAESPLFDTLMDAVVAATYDERTGLAPVLLLGFAVNRSASAYRGALDSMLCDTALSDLLRGALVPVLCDRATRRDGNANALIAAYSLEALFRFALDHSPTRYRLMTILSELRSDEPGLFAEHAAKLVGAAYHRWGDEALLEVLATLQHNEDAAGEAAYELAMAALATALDRPSLIEVREGLNTACELFGLALTWDPERLDAVAYEAVIDLLCIFAEDAPAEEMQAPLIRLERAFDERRSLLAIGRVPAWLQPRCDREVEWYGLLTAAREVARQLERPSWLDAGRVLAQVLALYEAERTVGIATGLHRMFAPRIEAAFVRQAGLAAHLHDLLADASWQGSLRGTADRLRTCLANMETAPARMVEENDSLPLLAAIFPEDEIARIPQGMSMRLEASLADYCARGQRIANPIVQKVFDRLTSELAASDEYRGAIKARFDALLLQLLAFCRDRQDVDRPTAGARVEYLRRADAAEKDLQFDLREFLVGNLIEADPLSEVGGVAAGRTDLYIPFDGYRFIIELKKYEGVADPAAARAYRSQASTYQGTNIKLGFLGILELADRPGAPPALDECFWLDVHIPTGAMLPRYLVVFRVPGRLKLPSAMH